MSAPDITLVAQLQGCLDWLTDYAINIDGEDEENLAQIRHILAEAIDCLRRGPTRDEGAS